jgi:hypothetical protein
MTFDPSDSLIRECIIERCLVFLSVTRAGDLRGLFEPHPIKWTQKESVVNLGGLTPESVGCQLCFQLNPLVIVEIDVFVNDLPGLLHRFQFHWADGFNLQMSKEILHGSIIPAIPSPRHGREDLRIASGLEVILRTVLRALVTMQNHLFGIGKATHGLLDCRRHQ